MSLPEDPPYLTSKDPASGKSGHAAGSVTRRGFLGSLTSAGIAATATPLLHAGAFTPEVISVATEAVRAARNFAGRVAGKSGALWNKKGVRPWAMRRMHLTC